MDFIHKTKKSAFTNDKSLWSNALYGVPLYGDILSASITNNRFNKYSKDTPQQANARDKYSTRQQYINATIRNAGGGVGAITEADAIAGWDALWAADVDGNLNAKKPPNYVSGNIKNPWNTGTTTTTDLIGANAVDVPNQSFWGYNYEYVAADAHNPASYRMVPGNVNIPHNHYRNIWLQQARADGFDKVGWDGQPSNWVIRNYGGI